MILALKIIGGLMAFAFISVVIVVLIVIFCTDYKS
jgi:hypothetical protein